MDLPVPALSRAVLIGTSEFHYDQELPNLPAVQRNLLDLYAVLTRPRVGIIPAENCAVMTSPETPSSFMSRLTKSANQAEDLLLVYYSGHGIRHDHKNSLYLTVQGTNPHAPTSTAVPFEWVQEAIADSPARTKLLILDCCYSGMALGAMSDGSVSLQEVGISGTSVIVSSPRNQISYSPPGARNTAFTAELLTLLADGPRVPVPLTVTVLYQLLKAAMAKRNLPLPKMKAEDTSASLLLRKPSSTKELKPYEDIPQPEKVVSPESKVDSFTPVIVPRNITRPAIPKASPPSRTFDQPRVPNFSESATPKVSGPASEKLSSLILRVFCFVLMLSLGLGGLIGGFLDKNESSSSRGIGFGFGVFFLSFSTYFVIRLRSRWGSNRHFFTLWAVIAEKLAAKSPAKISFTMCSLALLWFFTLGMFITGLTTPVNTTKSSPSESVTDGTATAMLLFFFGQMLAVLSLVLVLFIRSYASRASSRPPSDRRRSDGH